jgi:hypothetical protein
MDIYEAYEAFEMPDGYPFSGMTTRIQYTEPALPGGDAGCFPAAHSLPTLDNEYAVWLDRVRLEDPDWYEDIVNPASDEDEARERIQNRVAAATADWQRRMAK